MKIYKLSFVSALGIVCGLILAGCANTQGVLARLSILNTQLSKTKDQAEITQKEVKKSMDAAENVTDGKSKPTAANNVDVIGLRLGMTAQDAKIALQTHDAAIQVKDNFTQLSAVPNSNYLNAISTNSTSGEQIAIEFAPPPHPSVITKLTRTATYPAGAQLPLASTLQALTQKYGTPTQENNSAITRQLIWLYDQAGNKMFSAPEDVAKVCTTALSPTQMVATRQNPSVDTTMAACGVALSIVITTGAKPMVAEQGGESNDLVGQISASLTNITEAIRITHETQTYIETAERSRTNSVAAPKL